MVIRANQRKASLVKQRNTTSVKKGNIARVRSLVNLINVKKVNLNTSLTSVKKVNLVK